MTTVQADAGVRYDSMGDSMRFVLTAADTDGQYTLIEDTLKPGFHAALHLHRRHHETFYILEGTVSFTLDGAEVSATPGTTITIPPGVPHSARSDAPGKMLTIFSPGGLEGALAAFSRMTPDEARSPDATQRIMNQYDIVDLAQPAVQALLGLYRTLLAGDADALLAQYAGQPLLDTPLAGAVQGERALRSFVAEQQAWLSDRAATARVINAIVGGEHIVVEFVLHLTQDAVPIALPVAVVADRAGEGVTAIRVYHSTWPLTGAHLLRPPLLATRATPLEEPALIGAYMQALAQPDLPAILALFTDDGYVREPSGAGYRHAGSAARRAFYQAALGGGGVILDHRSATFDGASFAVEYVCERWGAAALPAQAGVAVYDLAGPDRLDAVRIYDDLSPPQHEP